MSRKGFARSAAKWAAAPMGLAAASYGIYVAATWRRYGQPNTGAADDADALLDKFMPNYDVSDRHSVRVAAPAEITFSAATETNLESCVLVRAIFKGRELILRSRPGVALRTGGFVADMTALGWGVLADVPGREIVMGGATKPWEANPVFRSVPPEEFETFREPGYVKIVFTLRADAAGSDESTFRTETRATAIGTEAHRKFRLYWAFLSPGIIAIRYAILRAVRREAERRWRGAAA